MLRAARHEARGRDRCANHRGFFCREWWPPLHSLGLHPRPYLTLRRVFPPSICRQNTAGVAFRQLLPPARSVAAGLRAVHRAERPVLQAGRYRRAMQQRGSKHGGGPASCRSTTGWKPIAHSKESAVPLNPQLEPDGVYFVRKKPTVDCRMRSRRAGAAGTWAWVCSRRSSRLARQNAQPSCSRWKATYSRQASSSVSSR